MSHVFHARVRQYTVLVGHLPLSHAYHIVESEHLWL